MIWNLPNKLTLSRLALAFVFFVLLGLYDQAAETGPWLLLAAMVLYVVSGLTDVADGYVARKYNLVTPFGRMVDPFVDKVLVVGAFTMLTGANFAAPDASFNGPMPGWVTGGMLTGVQAWMVVVILSREFAVTAIRGYSESLGLAFPAMPAGKLKMFAQSVAICTVLIQVAFLPLRPWAIWTRTITVWLAVAMTVISAASYVKQTVKLMRDEPKD
ncbi:MAG: CDP-alcohol phosphatidyltransferase family protein [Phycisphaerae bacterium]